MSAGGGKAKVPVVTKHARRRWRERRWCKVDDLDLIAVAAWRHGQKIPTVRLATVVKRYMGIDFIFGTEEYHPVLVTLYDRSRRGRAGLRVQP